MISKDKYLTQRKIIKVGPLSDGDYVYMQKLLLTEVERIPDVDELIFAFAAYEKQQAEDATATEDNISKKDLVKMIRILTQLAAASMCDEHGDRLYGPADDLSQVDFGEDAPIIFSYLREVAGLSSETTEELKKNSEQILAASSNGD